MATLHATVHVYGDSEIRVNTFPTTYCGVPFASVSIGELNLMLQTASDIDRLTAVLAEAREFLAGVSSDE